MARLPGRPSADTDNKQIRRLGAPDIVIAYGCVAAPIGGYLLTHR